MTVDISTIRAGDKVKVEGYVISVDAIAESLQVDLSTGKRVAVYSRNIVDHEPRAFKVGDPVRWVPCADKPGRVVHIHEGRAWVGFSDYHSVILLTDLRHA